MSVFVKLKLKVVKKHLNTLFANQIIGKIFVKSKNMNYKQL